MSENPSAPVAPDVGQAGTPPRDRSVLEEERDFFLRSLRDLEAERAAGDLDDTDYASLRDDYTVRAAVILRQLERLDAPDGQELPAPGVDGPAAESDGPESDGPASDGPPATPDVPVPPGPSASVRPRRRLVPAVAAGAVVAVGLAVWALLAASGTRSPGQTVSGQVLAPQKVSQLLAAGSAALSKQDAVTALKDYQAVLKLEPNQVEALTEEGWLLVQTAQSDLVTQGLGMLAQAERVQGNYAPAHLYRGIGLISVGDNGEAVPELQWYLAHNPDPSLKTEVQQALAKAESAG